MHTSIGKDFQGLWDKCFPDENLDDFYSKIFEIYDSSPDSQLQLDVVQAHAALTRHEYDSEDKPKDAKIKDAVIARALIHVIHQRNGQNFVEPMVQPFDNDSIPWLNGVDILGTVAMLENTGVKFSDLHLHKRTACDGRECFEMDTRPENKPLTETELNIARQQFGERAADFASRHIDNSGLEPYAGQHIAYGIEELLTDPERSSRYPKTDAQIAEKRNQIDARFPPEDLNA